MLLFVPVVCGLLALSCRLHARVNYISEELDEFIPWDLYETVHANDIGNSNINPDLSATDGKTLEETGIESPRPTNRALPLYRKTATTGLYASVLPSNDASSISSDPKSVRSAAGKDLSPGDLTVARDTAGKLLRPQYAALKEFRSFSKNSPLFAVINGNHWVLYSIQALLRGERPDVFTANNKSASICLTQYGESPRLNAKIQIDKVDLSNQYVCWPSINDPTDPTHQKYIPPANGSIKNNKLTAGKTPEKYPGIAKDELNEIHSRDETIITVRLTPNRALQNVTTASRIITLHRRDDREDTAQDVITDENYQTTVDREAFKFECDGDSFDGLTVSLRDIVEKSKQSECAWGRVKSPQQYGEIVMLSHALLCDYVRARSDCGREHSLEKAVATESKRVEEAFVEHVPSLALEWESDSLFF